MGVKDEMEPWKTLEGTPEDRRRVMNLLDIRQALGNALAERSRALARLRDRLPFLIVPLRWGLRLVGGDAPRADYTISIRRNGRGLYERVIVQSGLDRPVQFVLRFRRRDLDRFLDDLGRQQQRIIRNPWRLVRYGIASLRAIRWRTPSGVLTDPRPIALGIVVLLAVLFWRFWPYKER